MLNKLQLDQLRSKNFFSQTLFFQLENEHNGQWHYDSNNEVDQLVSTTVKRSVQVSNKRLELVKDGKPYGQKTDLPRAD